MKLVKYLVTNKDDKGVEHTAPFYVNPDCVTGVLAVAGEENLSRILIGAQHLEVKEPVEKIVDSLQG